MIRKKNLKICYGNKGCPASKYWKLTYKLKAVVVTHKVFGVRQVKGVEKKFWFLDGFEQVFLKLDK